MTMPDVSPPVPFDRHSIVLSEYGETLDAYALAVRWTREHFDAALLAVNDTLGTHGVCGGYVGYRKISETHFAISCRSCCRAFVFPLSIKTFGDLRQWCARVVPGIHEHRVICVERAVAASTTYGDSGTPLYDRIARDVWVETCACGARRTVTQTGERHYDRDRREWAGPVLYEGPWSLGGLGE